MPTQSPLNLKIQIFFYPITGTPEYLIHTSVSIVNDSVDNCCVCQIQTMQMIIFYSNFFLKTFVKIHTFCG